jgi:hypothetical protein
MKNITFILCILILASKIAAQAPQGINYQAVARNADTSPKANTAVTVGIKIKDALGADLYTENHNVTTNGLGLFNLTIGQGSNSSTSFSNLNWASGSKLLEVIINGQSGGTQPLLSVPYALYAEKTNLQAGNGISVSGNTISNTGDLSTTNEIQTLSLNNNQLSLSNGGGTVNLPAPNIQLTNVIDDMPTPFTTTVRGAAWQTMESKLQAQAPSAGTYLILYTLRATNFTDNDVVLFKVSNAVTGGDYTSSVLMSANNGVEDVTSTSFCITNLAQGEVVQVREKMEGSGSTTVTFQDGRLTLIKIQ